MNTLERSSVSFRRQGSSGRIWDNQFQAIGQKADVPQAAAMATRKRQEVTFQEMENQTPRSRSGNSTPPPPNSRDKGQRCAFSAVFGRCIGTRTPWKSFVSWFLAIICVEFWVMSFFFLTPSFPFSFVLDQQRLYSCKLISCFLVFTYLLFHIFSVSFSWKILNGSMLNLNQYSRVAFGRKHENGGESQCRR